MAPRLLRLRVRARLRRCACVVSAYRNDKGQMDTYWRKLPETDGPAECMEYLIEWWRSRRECEAAIYGDAEPPYGTTTTEAMLMAEDEAIEALLDALAGTEGVEKPGPKVCAAAPDLLRRAIEARDVLRKDGAVFLADHLEQAIERAERRP
jgi:hypothetical protein